MNTTDRTKEKCGSHPKGDAHCTHGGTSVSTSGAITSFKRCCWCGRVFDEQLSFVPEHGPYKDRNKYDAQAHAGSYP